MRGVEAGFDGVELHAANGYLFDQFLQDATRAVISVWGSDKVAVRQGPSGSWGDMSDTDPEVLFT